MNLEGVEEELGDTKILFRFFLLSFFPSLFLFLFLFLKTLMRQASYGSHEILKVTFHISLALVSEVRAHAFVETRLSLAGGNVVHVSHRKMGNRVWELISLLLWF